MNNLRRKQIREAMDLIQQAYEILSVVTEEEQDAFDNLPESLQESEKGEQIEQNVEELSDACDDLDSVCEALAEFV